MTDKKLRDYLNPAPEDLLEKYSEFAGVSQKRPVKTKGESAVLSTLIPIGLTAMGIFAAIICVIAVNNKRSGKITTGGALSITSTDAATATDLPDTLTPVPTDPPKETATPQITPTAIVTDEPTQDATAVISPAPVTHEHPLYTPGPTSTAVPTSLSTEELLLNKLNEYISESYKLLTEDERDAFEELHDTIHFRYFDEDGYAARSATSYGVFSGTSVWFLPSDTLEVYDITICGHEFYYFFGCEIKAFKDGEECEIDIAFSKGWLTEEDIAKLREIHSLTQTLYRPSASEEEINRLNELTTERYKLLTDAERVAFEELHELSRENIRYFDDEDGYSKEYITSYGVFSGASVWFFPSMMTAEYEMTVSGYTFYHSNLCEILVFKDGEECEINVAFSKGWLTEEDIATLYEIHTLVERIYY